MATTGEGTRRRACAPPTASEQRAYYRVEGWLPARLTPLAPEEVDQAIFELETDSVLQTTVAEAGEEGPLLDRMRRLEAKLDLLLGLSGVDVPRPLGAADRRWLVFSGAGLATDVDFAFGRGDCFRVEMLLPAPFMRLVRGVGEAVSDASGRAGSATPGRLALALRHMTDEDRDALVAYSYELQRLALRARPRAHGSRS